MHYPKNVAYIIDTLNRQGYEAYIVGGCVRDMLLSKTPNDYDICTAALPQQIKSCFKNHKTLDTGIKHGTITLLVNNNSYEITTFRTEGTYSDYRRPDNINFVTSIKEDLQRRDFTINAMAYNKQTGIIDYFHGQEHLKQNLLCAVLEPDTRFKEDALRILRGLRLASVYKLNIEDSTKLGIMNNKDLLKFIANERIQNELNKLLLGENVETIMQTYKEVFAVVLPELQHTFDFNQKNPYHPYDLYTHTVKAINHSQNSLVVRLTLLLHDLGKPEVFTIDDQGVGHFYQHSKYSCSIAETILKRLKYDNKTRKTVISLIQHHDSTIELSRSSVKKWISKIGKDNFLYLLSVKEADALAQNKAYLKDRLAMYNQLRMLYQDILNQEDCIYLKDLKLSGQDLISLGLSPGINIGIVLNHILDKVIKEELKNEHNQLMDYARLYIKKII